MLKAKTQTEKMLYSKAYNKLRFRRSMAISATCAQRFVPGALTGYTHHSVHHVEERVADLVLRLLFNRLDSSGDNPRSRSFRRRWLLRLPHKEEPRPSQRQCLLNDLLRILSPAEGPVARIVAGWAAAPLGGVVCEMSGVRSVMSEMRSNEWREMSSV